MLDLIRNAFHRHDRENYLQLLTQEAKPSEATPLSETQIHEARSLVGNQQHHKGRGQTFTSSALTHSLRNALDNDPYFFEKAASLHPDLFCQEFVNSDPSVWYGVELRKSFGDPNFFQKLFFID